MSADIIDYKIIGDDMQAVIITLDPSEAVVAEAGAMMYLDPDVEMATQLSMKSGGTGGVFGKLFEAGKRVVTGESFFITYFANHGNVRRDCAFAAPFPGHVIPIELADHQGELVCQKDSFLVAARGVEIGIAFQKKLGVGLFGGEGFILQRLRGDGKVFVHAGGTLMQKRLNGERLRVDTGCIVAFESGIDYDIELAGGLKSMLFGGEGVFLATLEGHGTVWLQSLPFARLADRVLENAVRLKQDDRS